jgi:hypothetical protein
LKRATVLALILVSVPAAPAGVGASGGDRSDVPDVAKCALGDLSRGLREFVPSRIARDERRYEASLNGLGSAERDRAGAAFATSEAAYAYGMPAVLMRATVARFPRNVLIGVGGLATPEQRTVVAPNHDTLYSVSQVDLSGGPMVIDAPATRGRYSVLQLLDAYSNAFEYVGSGSERDHDQTVVLAPPGWQGQALAGARVVESPTNLVWLLGRTLVDGPDDVPAATELMGRYALTRLAEWTNGVRRLETVIPGAGAQPAVELPQGTAFFDAVGEALAANPPPAADGCALAAFARVGIGPGTAPSGGTDPVLTQALAAGESAGERMVERAVDVERAYSRERHDGWNVSEPEIGRFGTDYAYRAVVADVGLAANVRREALYAQATVDERGRKLSGRHAYVLSFAPGGLPPVRAFWSLTMYDHERFLVANPIDRYNIGDRTPGLRYGRHGSLKVYIQYDRPAGAKAANWLPAPEGRFELHLRLYEPKRAAANGSWSPPTVRRVK